MGNAVDSNQHKHRGQHKHRVRFAGTWRQVDSIVDDTSQIYWIDAFAQESDSADDVLTARSLGHETPTSQELSTWLETRSSRIHVVGLSNAQKIGGLIAERFLQTETTTAVETSKTVDGEAIRMTNVVLVAAPTLGTGHDWCAANTITAGAIIDAMYTAGYRRASAECRLAVAGYRSTKRGLARFLNDTDSGQEFVRNHGIAALQQVVADY